MNDRVLLDSAVSAAVEAFIAAGIIIVCGLVGGLVGLRVKLFRAILFFGGVVASAVAAFAACDLVGRLLVGAGIPESWSLVAGFSASFLVASILVALFVGIYVPSRVMTYFATLDNLGGIAIGVLAGLLLASVVRVGFAMAPFPASARPSPDELRADVTPQILQMMAKVLFLNTEDEKAWLFGARAVGAEADVQVGRLACSEPFVDLNANGTREETEPFLDKNGDGEFTTSYAVLGPDSDDKVFVGVMDRYWLGDWRLVTVMLTGADD